MNTKKKSLSCHSDQQGWRKDYPCRKRVTIVDTVKLNGLTKAQKYQLKGWQMLKEKTPNGD